VDRASKRVKQAILRASLEFRL